MKYLQIKSPEKLLFVILIFGLINIQTQCNKDRLGPVPNKYQFEENASITPYKLNYIVGDTIWLKINVPNKKLFDVKSNARVLYDSINFTTTAQIDLVYNNPFVGTGPFAFFIFPLGVSAYTSNGNTQTFASISWGCSPSKDYDLTVGMVLLQKGDFAISLYNNTITKCSNGFYDNTTISFVFDVTDTHKLYYQQLPFSDLGKKPDPNLLTLLDKKVMVVINVK
jgi:hypothetical protein